MYSKLLDIYRCFHALQPNRSNGQWMAMHFLHAIISDGLRRRVADIDREMITLLSNRKEGGNSATFAANFPTFPDLVAFGSDWEGDPLCKSIPSALFEWPLLSCFHYHATSP